MEKRSHLHNHSPWIRQLKLEHPLDTLKSDAQADVVIIGGGIAGVVTAYFTLKNTKKKVILIEAGRVAHGATGHNAGQVVAYFERPFADLVKEFGLKKAGQAQKDILSAWQLLAQIRKDACMETPISVFEGFAGCASIDQVNAHLHNRLLRKKAGIVMDRVFVSDEVDESKIERRFRGLYNVVSHASILAKLETNDTRYVAALETQKGCMNSALFCEEIVGFLLSKYKGRFKLFENSPVAELRLFKSSAVLKIREHQVLAGRVVLCTNGFENIRSRTVDQSDIDGKFHEYVHGVVGFMAGFVEHKVKPPTAISYFRKTSMKSSDPYFYMTRRFYEEEHKSHHTLVCAGGPELMLGEKVKYRKDKNYKPSAFDQIDRFLRGSYYQMPCRAILYRFRWHGLMGYTSSGIRLVGEEPCNKTLLYNLGCNGIGILPSIFGGKRIADILGGKKVASSIFDPQERTCMPKSMSGHRELVKKVHAAHHGKRLHL